MPPPLPEPIAALLAGGTIPESRLDEALALWHGMSAELQTEADAATADRLFRLTAILATAFVVHGEPLRRRALLEGSLETLKAPEQRQAILCMLCEGASLERDIGSAQKWLALCDPAPQALSSDSAHRLARAMLDTAKGDYAAVCRTLGETRDEVPTTNVHVAAGTLLRANALEQMGKESAATDELAKGMSAGVAHSRAIAAMVELFGKKYGWHLCSQSYPAAEAKHAALASIEAARASGGALGCILIPLGVVFTAIGLFGVVMLVLGNTDTGGNALLALPPGAVALVFGWLKGRAARRAAFLAEHGERATGTVVSVKRTGWYSGSRGNQTPQYAITLSIERAGQPPVEAEVKHYLGPKAVEQLKEGSTFPVRVDPKDPTSAQFDVW